jgi:hypothetical protein
MLRHTRLDAPGALHHVICRGIERGLIGRDDTGPAGCVEERGRLLEAIGTPCYAMIQILPFHLTVYRFDVPPSTAQ